MMWKEEYIEFAKTPAGGGLSAVEATAQWAAWEADPDMKLRDELGPPRSPVRLWVKVGDFVSFDDIQSYLKKLEAVAEEVKKPRAEDLGQMRVRMMQGHETIAGQSLSSTYSAAAEQLVARGQRDAMKQPAFADEGVSGLHVRQLMDEDEPADDKAGTDDDMASEAAHDPAVLDDAKSSAGSVKRNGGAAGPPAKAAKKDPWFDAPRERLKCKNDWTRKLRVLRAALEKSRQNADKVAVA